MQTRNLVLGGATALVAAAGAWVFYGSGNHEQPVTPGAGAVKLAGATSATATEAGVATTFTCGNLTVPIGPGVPANSPVFINQTNADCFAWWEFISLNWPAAPSGAGVPDTSVTAATWGTPGDLSATVWQTYQDPSELFTVGATTPPPFGTQPQIPAYCAEQAGLTKANAGRMKLLTLSTSFDTGFLPRSVAQAAPGNAPNWLGAQNGTNLWYEVRIDQDEYNYVVDPSRQFFNANQQAAWVDGGSGNPIILPEGACNGPSCVPGTTTGAIEVKAAWMEAPGPITQWNQYKLAAGVVIDPATQKCRQTTLALVGLHILHKTVSQNTWVWATFEHVNNAPNNTNPAPPPPGGWNFYNPNCKPQQITVTQSSCLPQGTTSPVTVSCTPNQSPPYYIGDGCPPPVPLQVTRTLAVAPTAQTVNPIAWKAITAANANSVWQNYELVNVLWSTSTNADPKKPQSTPVPLSGMTSDNQPVANTTLETYAQTLTCTDCHAYATIAPTASVKDPTWSSDFSFMLGLAQTPPAAGTVARKFVRPRN